MLAQWDPFSEIARVHDRFFGPATLDRTTYNWKPAVDVFEDDKGLHVKVDVPGVKAEDIKIDVEKNVLTIRGERKLDHSNDKDGYHRIERFYGAFTRSFVLGDEVSAEDVNASYDSGVLRIDLPKRPAAQRREISVKSAT
jgi:HSP20 family protein